MNSRKAPVRLAMKIMCASVVCGSLVLGGCASQHRSMSIKDATATPLNGWDELPNASMAGTRTFGGQPSEAALQRYAAEGGTAVIDLRTHDGRDTASFDEQATVTRLGMEYVHLPMSSSTFSAADVDRFAEALKAVDGPVMVHCGSSNRVGGMWAAYLAREQGWETEKAIQAGKAAGMSSESVEEAARRVIAQ